VGVGAVESVVDSVLVEMNGLNVVLVVVVMVELVVSVVISVVLSILVLVAFVMYIRLIDMHSSLLILVVLIMKGLMVSDFMTVFRLVVTSFLMMIGLYGMLVVLITV